MNSRPNVPNRSHLLLASCVVLVGMIAGCQSDAQTGALLGSAVGAGAGAAIDHDNRGRGALIGAGIGAVGGYIVGNESDKNKAREAAKPGYDY
jgi:hypothetical protein